MGASQENRVGLKFKKHAAMAAERLRSHKVITEPMSNEAFMDGNDESVISEAGGRRGLR